MWTSQNADITKMTFSRLFLCLIMYVTHSKSVCGRTEPAIRGAFGLRFSGLSDGPAFHVLETLGLQLRNAGRNNNNNPVADACATQ